MICVLSAVLVSACVVVLLAVAGGRAWAGPKPAIAVLGLEVGDSGTGIDPETTRVAKELTAALRGRPAASAGPYALVSGGEKELIDEKLLNNCDTEAPVCMAKIGADLGAEVLLYGKIEKKPGGQIYQVSLKLLYVARKQVSSTQDTLPVADATGPRLATYAKTWYGKLAGGVSGGTLAIKANADRGTVLIDDEAKGSLSSGALSLTGIAEGRHTLAIEAKDYQRYESTITVRNGETLSHTATLSPMSKAAPPPPTATNVAVSPTPTKRKSNLWKPVFYTAAALDAAALGFTIYEWRQGVSKGNDVATNGDVAMTLGKTGNEKPGSGDCGDSRLNGKSMGDYAKFKSACDAFSRQKIGWVVTGAMSVAVVGSFIMAFVRDRSSPTEVQATGAHKKRREFAITPIVSPDGGGATLQIDW